MEIKGWTIVADSEKCRNRIQRLSPVTDRIYVVSKMKESGRWTCTCHHFMAQKKCHHLTQLKGYLIAWEKETGDTETAKDIVEAMPKAICDLPPFARPKNARSDIENAKRGKLYTLDQLTEATPMNVKLIERNAEILDLTPRQIKKYKDLLSTLADKDPIVAYAAKRHLQKIHCWKIWVPLP